MEFAFIQGVGTNIQPLLSGDGKLRLPPVIITVFVRPEASQMLLTASFINL